jgi:hypothetical protein
MNFIKYFLCLLLTGAIGMSTLGAQSSNAASGGKGTGTGGSVSYSVGQIVYTTNNGTNGIVSQGVQQPYEISIVTSVKVTRGESFECVVFPNPTTAKVKLVVNSNHYGNLRFQLYDFNGFRLQDKKIENAETEILMDNYLPSTYLLEVINGNNQIITFKIIKK